MLQRYERQPRVYVCARTARVHVHVHVHEHVHVPVHVHVHEHEHVHVHEHVHAPVVIDKDSTPGAHVEEGPRVKLQQPGEGSWCGRGGAHAHGHARASSYLHQPGAD